MFDSRDDNSSAILVQSTQDATPSRLAKPQSGLTRTNNAVANFSRNFEFGVVLAFVVAIVISSILNYLAIRISSAGALGDLLGDRKAPLHLDSSAFGYAFQWTTLIASSYVVFFGIYFLTDPKRAKQTSSTDAIQDRRFVSRIVEVFFFAFCVNICGNFVYQFCSSAFDVIFNRGVIDIDSLGKFSFFVRGLAGAFFGKAIGEGNNFQTSCIYVLLEFVLLSIILTIVLFWSRKYISEGRKVSLSLSQRDWHGRFDEVVDALGLGLADTASGSGGHGAFHRALAFKWQKSSVVSASAPVGTAGPVPVVKNDNSGLSDSETEQLISSTDIVASLTALAETRDVRTQASLQRYASLLAFRRLYAAVKITLGTCGERQRRAERTITETSARIAKNEVVKAQDQSLVDAFDGDARALQDKARADAITILDQMFGHLTAAQGRANISEVFYQSRVKQKSNLIEWLFFWRLNKEWQETSACNELRDALVILSRGDLKALLASKVSTDEVAVKLTKITDIAHRLLAQPGVQTESKATPGNKPNDASAETSEALLEAFFVKTASLRSGLDAYSETARALQFTRDEAERRLKEDLRDQDDRNKAIADCEKAKEGLAACQKAILVVYNKMLKGLDQIALKTDYLSKINRHGDDLSDSISKIVDRLWLIKLSTILGRWDALKKDKGLDQYSDASATEVISFIDAIPGNLQSAYMSGFKDELTLLTSKGGRYITQLAKGVFKVPTSNDEDAGKKDAIVALGAGEWVVTDALDVRGPKAILWSIVIAAAAFTVVNGCLAQPDRDALHYVWAFQTNLSIGLLFLAFSLPILFVSTVIYLNYVKLRDEEPGGLNEDGNQLEIFFGYVGIAALVLFVLFGAFVFFSRMPLSTAPGMSTAPSQTQTPTQSVTAPEDLICNVGIPSYTQPINGQQMTVWTFGASNRVEVDLEKCKNVGRFTGVVYVVGVASYEGKTVDELARADDRALAIAKKFPAATVRIINLGQAKGASLASGEQRPLVIIANKVGSGTADMQTLDSNALLTLKANLKGRSYSGLCTISAYSSSGAFDPTKGSDIGDAKFCAKITSKEKTGSVTRKSKSSLN